MFLFPDTVFAILTLGFVVTSFNGLPVAFTAAAAICLSWAVLLTEAPDFPSTYCSTFPAAFVIVPSGIRLSQGSLRCSWLPLPHQEPLFQQQHPASIDQAALK